MTPTHFLSLSLSPSRSKLTVYVFTKFDMQNSVEEIHSLPSLSGRSYQSTILVSFSLTYIGAKTVVMMAMMVVMMQAALDPIKILLSELLEHTPIRIDTDELLLLLF